jgi:hypothetical protein
MLEKLIYLWNRLQEPSTHASILALITYFHVSQADFQSYESAIALVVGALGVFVSEGKPASKVEGFNK